MGARKILDHAVLIFTGALFIFSGLIKVNDPIGTAIKLEEYFEVFASDFGSFFHAFIPISLELAVFVVVLEVVLGFAVLIRHQMKITAWLLLLIIVFFTFLTGYSAYFNKVTDCGCFGDAIKLTPWESFFKDIVLLVFIVYIFIFRKQYKPLIPGNKSFIVMAVVILLNTFLAFWAIRHLPFIDFIAYKIGNNIGEAMQPSEPYRYKYILEKDGETFEFEEYPTEEGYEYKDMILLNPEAQPKITDYHVWNDDGDFTEQSLTGRKLFIVVHNVAEASLSNLDEIQHLVKGVEGKVDVWLLTSNDAATVENFRHEYQLAIPYYYVDATVIKAMIRSNPGIMLLEDGTVLGKWHHNDTPKAEKVLGLVGK